MKPIGFNIMDTLKSVKMRIKKNHVEELDTIKMKLAAEIYQDFSYKSTDKKYFQPMDCLSAVTRKDSEETIKILFYSIL